MNAWGEKKKRWAFGEKWIERWHQLISHVLFTLLLVLPSDIHVYWVSADSFELLHRRLVSQHYLNASCRFGWGSTCWINFIPLISLSIGLQLTLLLYDEFFHYELSVSQGCFSLAFSWFHSTFKKFWLSSSNFKMGAHCICFVQEKTTALCHWNQGDSLFLPQKLELISKTWLK